MRTIMPAKILVSCKLFSREEKMSVMLLLLVSPMSYFTRISVLGLEEINQVPVWIEHADRRDLAFGQPFLPPRLP